jgi:hypothetical protein
MASPCISKAHQEYYCLTKYSVSNHKFTAVKWCDPCRELFKNEIESGKIISEEKKTRKRS